jgi:hypothetical protein
MKAKRQVAAACVGYVLLLAHFAKVDRAAAQKDQSFAVVSTDVGLPTAPRLRNQLP